MELICESGQIMVGAAFLLIVCVLFLFSVYDIALLWRDRAKLQQTVDAAALSTGAIMSDTMTLMKIYNILSVPIKPFFPSQVLAVGKAIDVVRKVMEKAEIFGSIAGMAGSDTFYVMFMTSPPDLGVHFDVVKSRFMFTETQNPGKRVLTVSGAVTTFNDRYLFKRYINSNLAPEMVLYVDAKVGIFQQGGLGFTYVPVLLK